MSMCQISTSRGSCEHLSHQRRAALGMLQLKLARKSVLLLLEPLGIQVVIRELESGESG